MADIKTLRVCVSSQLPSLENRDPNYIYFTYDKLLLYQGTNLLSDSFAITDSVPEQPVYGMLYILTDGTIHKIIDYSDIIIAKIENEDQIPLLKKAGTAFYANADHRYLDLRSRAMVLPFSNGSYELAVSMKNDIQIDDNTQIKYNTDNERFEIYGGGATPFIDYSKKFRGGQTKSAKIDINGYKIQADVKLSAAVDNILRIASDGLYAKTADKIDVGTFNAWADQITEFRKYATQILDNISAELITMTHLVSVDKITSDIKELTEARFPTVQEALEKYQEIVSVLDMLETAVMNYAISRMTSTSNILTEGLKTTSTWGELDNASKEYKEEVPYYDRTSGKKVPSSKEMYLIASAAILAYIEDGDGVE